MVPLHFSMIVLIEVLSNDCHHHLLPLKNRYEWVLRYRSYHMGISYESYMMDHIIWFVLFGLYGFWIWTIWYLDNLLMVDSIDFFLKSLSIWIWVSPFLSLNSAMKILKFPILIPKIQAHLPEISTYFVAIKNDNEINETYCGYSTRKPV